ncbi:MAG: metallophosphoesterase [Dysgonamonadaceae bacterium]|jgi:predicted MPP superfamily phosphohydrolase|nr:metallophosphoesterase [Dysgonamonadaceae bacterium]
MNQVIFLTTVFITYVLINFYIFRKGWIALKAAPIRVIYTAGFLLCWLAFPVAMLGRDVFPLVILKPLYFTGTSWIGISLYLLIIFTFSDAILIKRLRRFKNIRIQVAGAYIISICIAMYGYLKFINPTVIEQEIVINKPATHRALRIVGVSDLHLGIGIGKERLKCYVRLINEQKPDIVLIAGDLVDNTIRPLEEERMYEELRLIDAPMGVYACTGNHEYMGSGMEKCREFFNKADIILLEDSVTLIDSALWIICRDDIKGNPNRKPLDSLLRKTDASMPLILLDHEPNRIEEAHSCGIDLLFSGHTHNGQMFPGNIISSMIFEIPHGYAKRGTMHCFVSSGLGIWGPLFRIGTESDMVVFNMRFSEP